MARKSLRERNQAAIALDPDAATANDPAQTAQPPPAQDAPAPPVPAQASPVAPVEISPAAKAPAPAGTARIGIYLTPAEFTAAKAAYLTDWQRGGAADTFGRWIGQAIDNYADRTTQQRAATATPRGRSAERTGSTRSFSIPSHTAERMRAAISADHQSGRWPSDSAWCGEAIAASVAITRARNGGTLPEPPPRLPNRLVR